MGISGKKDKLFDLELSKKRSIPILKRFSGGGAVVVDENTIFVSFIFNKELLKDSFNHKAAMNWSECFYKRVFDDQEFHLRENDYVFANKKFGGNAQYFQKERAVHHTSFLWDFSEENMQLLQMPEKRPQYRQDRSHNDFLIKLKEKISSKEELRQRIKAALESFFEIERIEEKVLQEILMRPHRKSTKKDPP